MDVRIVLDVPYHICKRRHRSASKWQYENQIWPNHEKYMAHVRRLCVQFEHLELDGTSETIGDVSEMVLRRISVSKNMSALERHCARASSAADRALRIDREAITRMRYARWAKKKRDGQTAVTETQRTVAGPRLASASALPSESEPEAVGRPDQIGPSAQQQPQPPRLRPCRHVEPEPAGPDAANETDDAHVEHDDHDNTDNSDHAHVHVAQSDHDEDDQTRTRTRRRKTRR